MKTFEIFYKDLNQEAQKQFDEIFGNPSTFNHDIVPLAVFEQENDLNEEQEQPEQEQPQEVTQPKFLFTVTACRWFDKAAGNTYHSVRIIRNSDKAVISSGKILKYGYGEHYRQTALLLMVEYGWIDKKYGKDNYYLYERENNYPINWNVSDGLKREAVRNGEL